MKKWRILFLSSLILLAPACFADKTFTGNQNNFWRVEYEYGKAVEKKHKLMEEEKQYWDARSVAMQVKWDAMDPKRDARHALIKLKLQKFKYVDEIRQDPKRKNILKPVMEALDKKIENATLTLQAAEKAWIDNRMEQKVLAANAQYEKAGQELQRLETLEAEAQKESDRLAHWILNEAKIDDEDFANYADELYVMRIKLNPAEKDRYEREKKMWEERIYNKHPDRDM